MESVEFRNLEKIEDVDTLIIPIFNKVKSSLYHEIDRHLEGGLEAISRYCKAEKDEINSVTTNGKYPIPKIVFINIENTSLLKLQELGGKLIETIGQNKTIAFDGSSEEALALLFGSLLRSLKIPCYKTRGIRRKEHFVYLSRDPDKSISQFEESRKLLESIALARNLTVAPSNRLTPQIFAEKCKDLTSIGLKVEIFDSEELKKLGFHALLSVGKGSVNPPYVAVLHWEGGTNDPVAFVGKGVCFDSGGINLKLKYLLEMKWDKAGASAVVGIMNMLALSKVKINAIGIIGLVENMVDGGALKPGDIIPTHSGLTVEIIDTDNEGRLVLSDCLSYVQTICKPSAIIDLGTLTPETFGALAGEYAGLYCNDKALEKQLINAGEISGEKLWPLPMGGVFAKQIESEEADLKNSGILGFGEGGAAAEFLRCFVTPGTLWAHLDIAGVAWTNESQVLCQKGVTGYGVRLLYEWIKAL